MREVREDFASATGCESQLHFSEENSPSRDGLSNLGQALIVKMEKVKIDFQDIADANERLWRNDIIGGC